MGDWGTKERRWSQGGSDGQVDDGVSEGTMKSLVCVCGCRGDSDCRIRPGHTHGEELHVHTLKNAQKVGGNPRGLSCGGLDLAVGAWPCRCQCWCWCFAVVVVVVVVAEHCSWTRKRRQRGHVEWTGTGNVEGLAPADLFAACGQHSQRDK